MQKNWKNDSIANTQYGVAGEKRRAKFVKNVESWRKTESEREEIHRKVTRDNEISMAYIPPLDVVLSECGWVRTGEVLVLDPMKRRKFAILGD